MNKIYYENTWGYHKYNTAYERVSGKIYDSPSLEDIKIVSVKGEEFDVIRKKDYQHVSDHGKDSTSGSYQFYIELKTELPGHSTLVSLSSLIEDGYEVYFVK